MNDLLSRTIKKGFVILICLIILSPIAFPAEIHDLTKKGDIEKLNILIKQDKTLINLKDKNGKTPLHFAAQTNNLLAIEVFIKNGANINSQNINGVTPLHYTVYFGHKKAAELLIRNKVNLNIQDNSKRTALDFAIAKKNKDMVNLLVKNGVRIDLKEKDSNFIHMAAVNGFENLLEIILKKGGELNTLNIFGGTMLHSAVLGELPEIVKLMISKKVDLNHKDKYGKTAYYYAKNSENKKIITIIKNAGVKDKIEKKEVLKGNYYGQKRPGVIPELFAPQVVSRNGSNDRDIAFSKSGDEFYFTKNSRIMEVKKVNGIWTELRIASFSTGYDEAEAYFTPDNKTIYFISKRPKAMKTQAAWDIWFTEKQKGIWGKVQLMNSQFKGCFYTSFTNKWNMYYTGPDNNLYSSQYKDGTFEKSKKLGININTNKAEYNAFIAADESYLIFTTFGWGEGLGNGDLFISFRKKDGKWKKPVNMGKDINSKYHDYCPYVSPDGKYFFFTSNRLGNEDIYWVDSKIIKEFNIN